MLNLSFAIFGTVLLTAAPVVLGEVWYDPVLGSLPDTQGWTYFTLPPIDATFVDGAAVLDTSASAGIRGGWTRTANPPLIRAEGVRLLFTVEVVAETHTSTDRAGFSVILLDQDRRGIELGFWTDKVWAQSDLPLFKHAEEGTLRASGGPVPCVLTLFGDRYQLAVQRPAATDLEILQGPVRDYTAFTGAFDVYESPNFVFIGDDTTSASAKIRLQRVELIRGQTVPPTPAIGRITIGVQLHWPDAGGLDRWILESAADPVSGPWELESAGRREEAGSVVVDLDVNGSQRWFRLR